MNYKKKHIIFLPKNLPTHQTQMAIPDSLGTLDEVHYYQGIIIAEVAVTLFLYVILKVFHFVIWGAIKEEEAK